MVGTYRKRVPPALVMLLILLACEACLGDAAADYDRGLQLQGEKKYRAAIVEFGKVPPDSALAAKACYQTARCYREMMNLDDAIAACEKGLSLGADSGDRQLLEDLLTHLRFAPVGSLMKAGKWDEAIRELHTLAEDYPEEADWDLAKCYVAKGDYETARGICEGLVRTYGTSAEGALYDCYIANCLFLEGKLDEAFSHLARVIPQRPADRRITVRETSALLGLLEKTGRASEAKERAHQLITAVPASDPAIVGLKFYLANRQLREGRLAEAHSALGMLLEYPVGAWHGEIKCRLGDCCARLGDLAGAREQWQAVVSLFPGSPAGRAAEHSLSQLAQQTGLTGGVK